MSCFFSEFICCWKKQHISISWISQVLNFGMFDATVGITSFDIDGATCCIHYDTLWTSCKTMTLKKCGHWRTAEWSSIQHLNKKKHWNRRLLSTVQNTWQGSAKNGQSSPILTSKISSTDLIRTRSTVQNTWQGSAKNGLSSPILTSKISSTDLIQTSKNAKCSFSKKKVASDWVIQQLACCPHSIRPSFKATWSQASEVGPRFKQFRCHSRQICPNVRTCIKACYSWKIGRLSKGITCRFKP